MGAPSEDPFGSAPPAGAPPAMGTDPNDPFAPLAPGTPAPGTPPPAMNGGAPDPFMTPPPAIPESDAQRLQAMLTGRIASDRPAAARLAEAVAEKAGDDHRSKDVERERAKPEPKRLVGAEEWHHEVDEP